jgi:hypothetical protein
MFRSLLLKTVKDLTAELIVQQHQAQVSYT